MTTIACERCGASFDTDRDGVTPAQDTMRCPSCGASAALPDGDGDGSDDEEYECDECDRSFDSQRGLSSHKAQSHD